VTYPGQPEPDPAGPSPWAAPQSETDSAYGWQPPTQPDPASAPGTAPQNPAPAQYPSLQDPSYPSPQYPASAYPAAPYQGPVYPGPAYPGQPAQTPPPPYDPTQGYLTSPSSPYGHPPYPPVKRMSTGIKVLLIALPILLVVAIGVGVAALVASNHRSNTARASATPAGSLKSAPTFVSGTDHFTLPTTVGGLPLSTDPAMSDLGKLMTDELGGSGSTTAVAGAYVQGTDKTNLFLLVGVSKAIPDPGGEVNGVFTGLGLSKEYTIGKRVTYDAGPQGGVMSCANATLSAGVTTVPIGVCAIGDPGGLIVSLYFSHSGTATAKVTQAIRASFEH
jgi:hypothetical protein